ncbi:uncharacterized protein Dmoj_GI27043 [Drosophila mojavensis]|uniref:BPTI/Kunitz inhibitor domain-containing protein n=1 Tax=Drosophila mojavensis TaxID=7230 RepID=A0A0Q9X5C4_DROMO|nr:uncharacterized protein Dmoj_GI27043 [Drosophila mojavensis]
MKFAFVFYLACGPFLIVLGHRQHAICRLPPGVRGTCNIVRNMWSYHLDTNECEMFPYNGCLGNSNIFPTLELCEDVCKVHRKHKKINTDGKRAETS